MSNRYGYRGYISSRPVSGISTPQRVQNLVIRDYTARRGLGFKLSATEYAMSGCYMILSDVLKELAELEGIVLFSLFMLPANATKRREIYQTVLSHETELHCALEGLVLRSEKDILQLEDTLMFSQILPSTIFGGRYEKDGAALRGDDDALKALAIAIGR